MNEENKMIKDVALDWLQYGDRWDEIKSEMALKYISSLKAENARYREALEFYADVFLWCSPTIASNEYLLLTNKTDLGDGSFNFDDYSGRVCTDNNIAGRRAREALKGE